MNLEGKVALITGSCGSGIGRSIALTLAREGAAIILNHRKESGAEKPILEEIQAKGGKAVFIAADIRSKEHCSMLAGKAQDTFGEIDICVINPGGGWHPQGPDKLNPSEGLDDMEAEVAPVYNLFPLVLPSMYKNKWGRLIAISMNLSKPSPAMSYNIAKAARTEAMLLAANETWSHGVTANVIAPGPVGHYPDLQTAVEHSKWTDAWYDRKNVTPQDIAEGVAFLCSESANYINGCVLPYMFK